MSASLAIRCSFCSASVDVPVTDAPVQPVLGEHHLDVDWSPFYRHVCTNANGGGEDA
jgi:hypothetical protein